MIKKNKILGIFLVATLIFSFSSLTIKAQEKEVNLYFFWGQGCPHCAKEKPFLENLKQKYPQLHVYDFEVWYNQQNRNLLIQVSKILNVQINGVPVTIINDQPIIGYYDDNTTGQQIEDLVVKCLKTDCQDSINNLPAFKNLISLNNQNNFNNSLFSLIKQKLQAFILKLRQILLF